MYLPDRRAYVPQTPFYGHYQIYPPVSHLSYPPVSSNLPFLHPPPLVSNSTASAPLRRKRASKPKVRTGCTTCKIRRIKCDETKPHCKRCTSTGRKCDGYQFLREELDQASSADITPPPKTFATLSQLFLPSSVSTLPFDGTTKERRIFHRFEVCTIPAFLGGSETGFWTDLVLKVGCEEPVVRNAIIALGTLHEDYQERGGKYNNALIKDPSYQYALSLYGTALRQLNRQLAQGNKTQAKLAIISSILFACFEVLRRNNMAAVIHYQAGMRELIRQMDLAQRDATTSSPPNTLLHLNNNKFSKPPSGPTLQKLPEDDLNTLLRVFARYDVQACTFSPKTTERLNVSSALDNTPPTSFTLSDVRTHLDNLLISIYQLAKSDLAMYRYWPLASVPWEHRLRRDEGIHTFSTWLAALENFFTTAESRLSASDLKSFLGIRLQIKVALIMLETSIDSGPETGFDVFGPEFEDIVARVERMTEKLGLPEARPLDNESTSFTMELGVIHPLFFVACKCRHRLVRRRAIAQLRKAGREGVWEGPIVAVLAERLVEMEEGAADEEEVEDEGVDMSSGPRRLAEGDGDGGEWADELGMSSSSSSHGGAEAEVGPRSVPEGRRWHDIRKDVDYETCRVLVEGKRARDLTWTRWETVRMAVPF